MEEPRICVVGAGSLSSRRIYPYLAPAGALLVGVCDLEPEKARRNARLYGGQCSWSAAPWRRSGSGRLAGRHVWRYASTSG